MRKILAVAALTACVTPIQAFADPLAFEGSAAIEDVSPGCKGIIGNHGYESIFYQYSNNTTINDAILLLPGRSAFRLESSDPSHALNGAVSTNDVSIGSHTTMTTYVSSSNLSISTVGGNALSAAVNVKILGTINDFLEKGCTITIHALLIVRPAT